jgi:LL-diaminopimelate aminotransferase
MKFTSLAVCAVAALPALTSSFSLTPSRGQTGSAIFSTSADASVSQVERNENFAKLAGGYLFPEIGRRRNAYLAENPEMADRLISLGIGDTTMPIPPHILNGLVEGAKKTRHPGWIQWVWSRTGSGSVERKKSQRFCITI